MDNEVNMKMIVILCCCFSRKKGQSRW